MRTLAGFRSATRLLAASCVTFAASFAAPAVAQSGNPLEHIPGYDRYLNFSRGINLASGGSVRDAWWTEDGTHVVFQITGDWLKCNLDTGEISPLTGDEGWERPTAGDGEGNTNARRRPARGRQRSQERSPDGNWTAICRDWNVVLEHQDSDEVINVTTDGDQKLRYGMASWVYGEELDQNDAMWWSPDSKVLA